MSVGCTNCGDARIDVYCAHCGEKQPDPEELSIRHFTREAVEEIAHVDSKLVRTLRDLSFRPGLLPAEYFAGRKKRYVAPLRLFLIFFALQFVAYTFYKPVSMYSVETLARWDKSGRTSASFDERARKLGITRDQFIERLDNRWRRNLSLLQLGNVVGVALVLALLYARRRRYLAEHLVFSAYYLAFSYFLSLVVWPVYYFTGLDPGPIQGVLSILFTIVNLVYLYVGMRRFYGQGKGKTMVKTLLLWGGIYVVALGIIFISLIAAMIQSR